MSQVFLDSVLKNSNISVLEAKCDFPEDIDNRISKFGQRVVESLKTHLEADEFFKDKKILCDVTWVEKPRRRYIQIKMWDEIPAIS